MVDSLQEEWDELNSDFKQLEVGFLHINILKTLNSISRVIVYVISRIVQ